MNTSVKLILTTFSLLFVLSACTEEQTVPITQTTQAAKPSKLKAATIEKIQIANAGMLYEQASCVLETMMADDQYGLAEINPMNLSHQTPTDNPSGLFKAYKDAIKTCQ